MLCQTSQCTSQIQTPETPERGREANNRGKATLVSWQPHLGIPYPGILPAVVCPLMQSSSNGWELDKIRTEIRRSCSRNELPEGTFQARADQLSLGLGHLTLWRHQPVSLLLSPKHRIPSSSCATVRPAHYAPWMLWGVFKCATKLQALNPND